MDAPGWPRSSMRRANLGMGQEGSGIGIGGIEADGLRQEKRAFRGSEQICRGNDGWLGSNALTWVCPLRVGVGVGPRDFQMRSLATEKSLLGYRYKS